MISQLIRNYLFAIKLMPQYEFDSPFSRRLRLILALDSGAVPRWPWWRVAYYGYNLLFFARMNALTYALELSNDVRYAELFNQLDTVVSTIARDLSQNAYFGICMAPTWLFAIYLDYAVYVKPNHRLWTDLHQIWHENGLHFWALNSREFYYDNDFWRHPVRTAPKILHYFGQLAQCQQANFHSRLSHLPNLSVNVRTRAILAKQVIERLEFVWHFGDGMMMNWTFLRQWDPIFHFLNLIIAF